MLGGISGVRSRDPHQDRLLIFAHVYETNGVIHTSMYSRYMMERHSLEIDSKLIEKYVKIDTLVWLMKTNKLFIVDGQFHFKS